MKSGWKPRVVAAWRNWGLFLVLMTLGVTSFRSAIADWNDVPSGSMRPTILEGERIFVNRLAYDLKVPFTRLRLAEWGDPERGDVVICRSPVDGKRLVKRVIGLPGDRIAMRDNHLTINGGKVRYDELTDSTARLRGGVPTTGVSFEEENLGSRPHCIRRERGGAAPRNFREVLVPERSYLVMGDNRDCSADSRAFGFMPREDILGESLAVITSLDPDNHYLPRWGRFFQKLD